MTLASSLSGWIRYVTVVQATIGPSPGFNRREWNRTSTTESECAVSRLSFGSRTLAGLGLTRRTAHSVYEPPTDKVNTGAIRDAGSTRLKRNSSAIWRNVDRL